MTLKATVAEVQAPERHAEQMAARVPDSSRCACTAGQLPTMPETPNKFCVTEQEERKQTSKEVVARAVELLEPTSVEPEVCRECRSSYRGLALDRLIGTQTTIFASS